MRKGLVRVSRPALRPVSIGTLLVAAVLGSSIRADATPDQPRTLAARTQAAAAEEATLPTGFQESVVFDGLTFPTNLRFSPDGRVFVAEKSGIVDVYDDLNDTTPTVFADLRDKVDDYWDRGLLGLALDPDFPASPYVYVLYTYDAGPGQSPPVWHDKCPTPPGPTTDGCVVTARLSRLTATGDVMTGEEQVLLTGWCQQYPSHSIGDLRFGPDGALYVSGGDGANFINVDIGQWGGTLPNGTAPITPKNPCGDPPGGVGGAMTAPSAEGGALRAQSRHRLAGATLLNGTILRIDPATGDAMPDNPLAESTDEVAQKIVAEGLRNPFRFALRPGTDDLWIGDVGWNDWEEINRLVPSTTVRNFGWPCYEGVNRQAGYDGANLDICESLYASPGAVTSPHFAYHHTARVVPNEGCPTGSSSVAGTQFAFGAGSGPYPAEYDDALFFADYSRDCIWVMPKGADGLPAPGLVRTFVAGAANPVNLQVGPTGELFYVDFDGGTIRRIGYASTNRPPVAEATATPTTGSAPLTVSFDGSASSDPDAGDTLAYAWDLDGDGAFDDSTATQPTWTYTSSGTYTATLRVTDPAGATATDAVTISVGNTAPVPVINTPAAGTLWRVGDTISFSGGATDAQDGTLPASALTWEVVIQHCPSNCHSHPMQSWVGVSSGSFPAPDHEAPVYLELKLTATDSGGLSTTVVRRLDPRLVALTFASVPGGLNLTVGSTTGKATFTRNVVVGSTNSVSAVSPQTKGNKQYAFTSWSDGGAQTHTIVAPATATTYTARFK